MISPRDRLCPRLAQLGGSLSLGNGSVNEAQIDSRITARVAGVCPWSGATPKPQTCLSHVNFCVPSCWSFSWIEFSRPSTACMLSKGSTALFDSDTHRPVETSIDTVWGRHVGGGRIDVLRSRRRRNRRPAAENARSNHHALMCLVNARTI